MLDFLPADELDYGRAGTVFTPGQGLRLDESYRLAHLPLVAPSHPDVIIRREGRPYEWGRRPVSYSLVVTVPWALMSAAPVYRALDADLRAAPFAHKIAWDIAERRRDKLHATLGGGLSAEDPPPAHRAAIARCFPVTVALRGLFSGTFNVGRLYLPLVPARVDGRNPIRAMQEACGLAPTRLYLVGLHSFTDHLTADEAAALDTLIRAWSGRDVVQFEVTELARAWSRDDLLLDGGIDRIAGTLMKSAM